ncbi:6,7-dimethyl-8-ribityllumazine synthase [Bartonella sp. HY329]|uniref:6,7-dimethyl-8-ribityllumazine synthase n=1 Tax=unclassified Bartonella TaxID=2645622 RepID=UPI0021CAD411|nr:MULTISPECIES: 6,7-dimethyl-8-ribityllumazine synthase [unclassified Bartonella]UXM93947.1 6,7-dimethyl-8-ribityllumazine synthase [Bartonella sp. HY329]UXN08268.1 6,7-dimethyl-8-ribityllumazine synthase [Bartonella sp. HY328]
MNSKKERPLHLLIVEARFYDHLADSLLEGAKKHLDAAGATYDVVTVPGALEIPSVIANAYKSYDVNYDGYIALGCVIRGETYHFEIVANESCRGIMELTMRKRLAIGNGILTVENEEQAIARASVLDKDKGGFAADAALKMIALKKQFGVSE